MVERRLVDVENISVTWTQAAKTEYGNDFEGGVLFTLDKLSECEESVVRCKRCRFLVLTEDGEHNPEDCVCAYWQTDGLTDEDYCSRGEIGKYVRDPLDGENEEYEGFVEMTLNPLVEQAKQTIMENCGGKELSNGEVLAIILEHIRHDVEKGGEQHG